jgi:hypothetical protein
MGAATIIPEGCEYCKAENPDHFAVLHIVNAFVPGRRGGSREKPEHRYESACIMFECEEGHRFRWLFTEHSGDIVIDEQPL